ncbi:hypothetical protein ACIPYS_17965 [Kitasatospora sp. NPDC089913]|uniref:hypothetical protein n=1 Tax=Kitasatospora sp. NPDC089913 TaxID=3364080 RepID=UPI003823BFB4
MTETRKHYSRRASDADQLQVQVIYDDTAENRTYLMISAPAGVLEALLTDADVRALVRMLSEAEYAVPPF